MVAPGAGGIFVKLGSLAIRTVSKPLANSFKKRARNSDFWRAAFAAVGQKAHNAEFRIRARLIGHRVHTVKPLEDAKAIGKGADIVGELIVFGVAASLVVLELVRKARADEVKAQESVAAKRSEMAAINARFALNESRLEHIERSFKRMNEELLQANQRVLEAIRQGGGEGALREHYDENSGAD